MTSTIERNGRTYSVTIEHDETGHGAPWMNEDGHGHISDWTSRDKAPGERVMASDRNRFRYYDIAETTKLAKREGWGLSKEGEADLAKRLGREPTRKQIIAEAVRQDFERMRGWCNDEWHYVGVVVELLDDEGDGTGNTASLWGIESDADDYLDEVAAELVDELEAPLLAADVATLEASRPDMYAATV